MLNAKHTINFIPPELYPYLQTLANEATEGARSLDLIKGNDKFTARTIALEILRSVVPNPCTHLDFMNFNTTLLGCKGCHGLFSEVVKDGIKHKVGPIKLLDLIPLHKYKVGIDNVQKRISILTEELHKKIVANKFAILDREYQQYQQQKAIGELSQEERSKLK